jgi:hypothetical protein
MKNDKELHRFIKNILEPKDFYTVDSPRITYRRPDGFCIRYWKDQNWKSQIWKIQLSNLTNLEENLEFTSNKELFNAISQIANDFDEP